MTPSSVRAYVSRPGSRPASGSALPALTVPQVQRCACGGQASLGPACAECQRQHSLQRSAAGPAGTTAPPIVNDVVAQTGAPLLSGLRKSMSSRLGADFTGVRLHTNDRAAASAGALNAEAYSVGPHIVFGAGRYAPGAAAGQRLLAHELAHVVQQGGRAPAAGQPLQVALADSPLEDAADRAAASVAQAGRGGGIPPNNLAQAVVQRQEATTEPTVEAQASRAELFCDLSTLCRLRFQHPDIVPVSRVMAAVRTCRPGEIILGDPCLSLATLPLAARQELFSGGGRSRSGTSDGGPLAPVASGGTGSPVAGASGGSASGLSDLLTFNFSAGPVRFNVQLPSEASARLPIALSAGRTLDISLTAATSGTFSLNFRLDALPHILLSWRTAVDAAGQTVSTGLTITSRRTVCRATPNETIRRDVETKGRELTRLVNEYQAQIATLTFEEQRDRLIGIASQVADIYESAQRAEEPCRQQPLLELNLGTTIPFGTPEPGAPPTGPSVGATLTLRIPGT